MNKPKVIGIAGYAGIGKDTLYTFFSEFFQENGENLARIAFADKVKDELNSFAIKTIGISPFTKDPSEKKIIRHLLVGYAEAQRALDPDIWVKKVQAKTDFLLTRDVNVCITDVRYENETNWILPRGIVIYLNREKLVPPNDTEIKNNAKVKPLCDLVFDWPEVDSKRKQKELAREIYKEIMYAYNRKFGVGPQYEGS